MINRILERLSAESKKWLDVWNDASKKGIIDNYADGMNDGFDEAISIVQEVAKEGGWIPCSERMPEAQKNVLVCENNGEIHLCRYNANIKRFFYDGSDWDIKLGEVIAWQPLPAPYQKGE